jgi:hypothetical protein
MRQRSLRHLHRRKRKYSKRFPTRAAFRDLSCDAVADGPLQIVAEGHSGDGGVNRIVTVAVPSMGNDRGVARPCALRVAAALRKCVSNATALLGEFAQKSHA